MKTPTSNWGFTPGERRALMVICAALLIGVAYRSYQRLELCSAPLTAQDSAAVAAVLSAAQNGTPDPQTPAVESPELAGGAPLNLNTARPDQLTRLPGIGPVLAQRIIEARDRRGGFRSVEDLLIVEGIGNQRLEKIRSLVVCSP
jgi:competence ComEA-like helix-hairpin-helix protein